MNNGYRSLVLWATDPTGHWYYGPLVLWAIGPTGHGSYGPLILRAIVLRAIDLTGHWSYDLILDMAVCMIMSRPTCFYNNYNDVLAKVRILEHADMWLHVIHFDFLCGETICFTFLSLMSF